MCCVTWQFCQGHGGESVKPHPVPIGHQAQGGVQSCDGSPGTEKVTGRGGGPRTIRNPRRRAGVSAPSRGESRGAQGVTEWLRLAGVGE